MRTLLVLIINILIVACGGCAVSVDASLRDRELNINLTERLRIDLDDGEVIWECPVMTGKWLCMQRRNQ